MRALSLFLDCSISSGATVTAVELVWFVVLEYYSFSVDGVFCYSDSSLANLVCMTDDYLAK